MKTLALALLLAMVAVSRSVHAEDTNNLNTFLGQFENKTNVMIIKGFGDVGTIPFNQGEVRVRSRESQNLATGQKMYGLVVEWGREGAPHRRILLDDDEVEGLINAVNYLVTIDYKVTKQPGFEASFQTRAGLQAIARSERKEGAVFTLLQFDDSIRIPMTSVQMQLFSKLLQQGRKNLETLKAG